MTLDTRTWDALAESAVDARAAINAATETVAEVKAEEVKKPHRLSLTLRDVKQDSRVGYVPEEFREFLVQIPETDYAPPFWIDKAGSARSIKTPVPMCPPVEPGKKILVLSGGERRVVTVTGMFVDEEGLSWIECMFGSIPLRAKSWVALTDEAPLTQGPTPRQRLTDEESKALEEELESWSRFLGFRAQKYGWCSTFENILRDVGVEPHRPGYKTVTLSFHIPIKDEAVVKGLKEKYGEALDESALKVKVKHTITNVERHDYEGYNFNKYLNEAGYEGYSDVSIFSQEAMTEEDL